jgi:apolipoprotein N-acyltransferase
VKRLSALGGPRWRAPLALTAGVAAALAHPPFGFLPGLLGYGLLMHLLDRRSGPRPLRSAFVLGWLAGLAYFAIGTWWVGEAFLVDAARQGWMAPFAVSLLSGGLALFWGGASALYSWASARGVSGAPWRVLVFAGCLSLFEWLRGHVLTGLPWNLPGESFRAGSALSQGAALIGAYGLTFVVVAVFAGLTLVRESRRGAVAALAAAGVLASLFLYGTVRLQGAQAPFAGAPVVRIIQPDVPQEAKYDAARFQAIFASYLALTPSPGRPADLVIWPEGAIPAAFEDYLAPSTWTRAAIAKAMSPGQTLLVGGYRQENGRYYNSLLALRGPELAVQGRYDKHRLVPFGEYLPLEPLWLGVKQMVGVGDGFTPGPPPAPIAIGKGLPVIQPLICYESLFPGFTRMGVLRSGIRPSLIVNISNDAWFGRTSGPKQHLNLASYRAIEEGLPLVRATPTGISAIVDPFGQTKSPLRLELGSKGSIEAALPPTLPPTFYQLWGEWPFWMLLFVAIVTVWTLDGRRRIAEMAG